MLFNSFEFVVFLLVVFLLYWHVFNKNLKVQNALLLFSSYFFYACWNWKFLFLLVLSTLIDYVFGLLVHNSVKYRKLFYWLSIVNNLAVLGFFKYYNFFAVNIQEAFDAIGIHFSPWLLSIVAPVGISFYTFHGMSYVFDIYKKRIEPTRDFVAYADFVCFFPLLVAGPIERGSNLLPQIKVKRTFNYEQALDGFRLILWGFFLKVVIADTLAVTVNEIFGNYKSYPGSTLILGALYFSVQIYGDFCGYTSIAIGVAKLFGFELLSNFRYPYFASNLSDFWRRWHISLSSWFRDYIYIPLGGARVSRIKVIRNTFIIFLISGFWHGANWTFIMWGVLHAVGLTYEIITKQWRGQLFERMPKIMGSIIGTVLTFTFVCFAYIFFRAPNIHVALDYIRGMGNGVTQSTGSRLGLIYVAILFLLDWFQRESERRVLSFGSAPVRWALYVIMGMSVLIYSVSNPSSFIYFQF